MRLTVVSPHLDDAVLSAGGTIYEMVRRGVEVTIVSLFAGDPDASSPPSYWDAGRGESQGVAVRQRRDEDRAAAAELGASVIALPWADSGYVGVRNPDAIWQAIEPTIGAAAATLLPGWPLSHADHRYATMLVLERIDASTPIAFYAEQPYAAEPVTLLKGMVRRHTVAPLRHAYDADIRWHRNRLSVDTHRAHARAVAHYAGEVQNLGIRGRWGGLYRRFVGEWLGIGQKVPLPPELGLT